MFLRFFEALRAAKIPVSLREYLSFLEAMKTGLVLYDVEGFYFLARATMVKDERNLDKFDLVFADVFKGMENLNVDDILNAVDVPDDWLTKLAEKHLSAEEMAEIEEHNRLLAEKEASRWLRRCRRRPTAPPLLPIDPRMPTTPPVLRNSWDSAQQLG